jgi:hypothetical protein
VIDTGPTLARLSAEYSPHVAARCRQMLAPMIETAEVTALGLVLDEGFAPVVASLVLVGQLLETAQLIEAQSGTEEGVGQLLRHLADLAAADASALAGRAPDRSWATNAPRCIPEVPPG